MVHYPIEQARNDIRKLETMVKDCNPNTPVYVHRAMKAIDMQIQEVIRREEREKITNLYKYGKEIKDIESLANKFADSCGCSKMGLILKVLPTPEIKETQPIIPIFQTTK